jgi:hypothetical protein
VLVAVPFVADYARSQDEALDNRQRALQTLASTVASSAEQIAIATDGLQKLTAIAQENVAQSERAAQQIHERIAELRSALAAGGREDAEAAAKLEAVARKIAKSAAELEAAATRAAEARRVAPEPAPVVLARAHPLELPPVIANEIVEIKPVAPSVTYLPFEAPGPAPAPATAPLEPAAATPAPRRRSPRKAAPAAESQPTDPVPEAPAAAAPAAAPEAAGPAVSPDGATRLVVTAYIGIGNRLFIRGEGPGLTWERGVPLAFVSIGKWRWETSDATSAVRFKLYKNDEVESVALGERSVEPGAQLELNAAF